ncbi:RNA-directed DNA polymerase (Reverse transcriptase), Ribonuclease H-like protein [Gossypium australe]|uniref:RNA-directed DNA polymerase (Reverse transcriptase), Ribonuclease H-like protein n=1 Tax=Gossypium australe TaxID=47621 RepID=A0A5B6WIL9_9ROSI|nr:RNA-directed DNA polymerase (Reverse transcriptase), Ribonuclease H-like protein [Gossypium australe]
MTQMTQLLNGLMDKGKSPMVNVEENTEYPQHPPGFTPPHVQTRPETSSFMIRPQQFQAGALVNLQTGSGSGYNPIITNVPNLDEIAEGEKTKVELPKQLEDRCKWLEEKFKTIESADNCYGIDANDIAPDRITLQDMEKKTNESFRQYAQHWRREMIENAIRCEKIEEGEGTKRSALRRRENEVNNMSTYNKGHSRAIKNLFDAHVVAPFYLTPLQPPFPKWYDANAQCEYHAGIAVHSIENCTAFKKVVEKVIKMGIIKFDDPPVPNVAGNPLPNHTDQGVNGIDEGGGRKVKHEVAEECTEFRAIVQNLMDNKEMEFYEEIEGSEEREVYASEERSTERVQKGNRPVVIISKPRVNKAKTQKDQNVGSHTRSGRRYDLIKGKAPIVEQEKEKSIEPESPVNEPVREEEAREFLKFLKAAQTASAHICVSFTSEFGDNGSALNVLPLSTLNRLPVDSSHMKECQNIVRAFDGTQRRVMGRIEMPLLIVTIKAEEDIIAAVTSDAPYLETNDEAIECSFRSLEFVNAAFITEGNRIPIPKISKTTRIGLQMTVGKGALPGKGLGKYLQGKVEKAPKEEDIIAMLGNVYINAISEEAIEGGSLLLDINDMSDAATESESLFEQDMCLEGSQDFEYDVDCGLSLDLLRMVKQEERQTLPHEETVEVVTLEEGKSVKIGTCIPEEMKRDLVDLLQEFKDVFAWSYQDMPGLSTDIVVHRFPIKEDCKPVQQMLRRTMPDIVLKIKEKVKKQFDARFLQEIKYLEWIANIVPVPKKDGKMRMCVDYRDLNKASLKDNFSLPHIDTLVDNTAGYSLFSFMDGFSGIEEEHIRVLRKLFLRLKKFQLKLNPTKYTFGARSGKLLGFIVSEKGIEIDSDKVQAVQELPQPSTQKEVRCFLGRLNYIARFIS